jgi:exopolysaccharide biosynthesis WecB/TagA/CpsF family protein
MKILVIHNFYQSSAPSGEDILSRNEIELLSKNGINVITYERHNDDIIEYSLYEQIKTPYNNIWSRDTYREINTLIREEKPDIAHFHNIFYLISPSGYYACKDAGVSVVQTLHNFRFFCVNGLLMRNGSVCEDCVGKTPWRGAIHGCYRQSRLHSIPLALMQNLHKYIGTWQNAIDAHIALTEFSKQKFVDCGLSEEKVFVKPNFVSNPPERNYANDGYAVFIGRLSNEKGVHVAIDAIRVLSLLGSCALTLKVVGDGPLRNGLEDNVRMNRHVEIVGSKSPDACIKLLKGSRFLVMPSVCYEGFPMTIAEAYACGKPVIASNLGSLAELVEHSKTGLLFEPGNPQDLARKMKWMIEHEGECMEMGKNARRVFEEKYTAERNFKILMEIYNTVLNKNRAILDSRANRIPILFRKRISYAYPIRTDGGKSDKAVESTGEARSYDGNVTLQGVKFSPVDIGGALQHVTDRIQRKDGGYYCLANIHVVMESHRDYGLRKVLNDATGVFADGMGTAGALKYLSHMFKGRVRGTDLMLRLCQYAANNSLKVFLYGNTEETLERLRGVLKSMYPRLNLTGTYSPPFRELSDEEDEKVIGMINKAGPDILFVSLGAPKQEKWMAVHKGRIKAIQIGVGAGFDYIAGNLKEAPGWMQKHYLEWLYRMHQQPRKTIYRMSLLPEFLIRLFIQRFWR